MYLSFIKIQLLLIIVRSLKHVHDFFFYIFAYDLEKECLAGTVIVGTSKIIGKTLIREFSISPLVSDFFLVLAPNTLLGFIIWDHFNSNKYITFDCLASERNHFHFQKFWKNKQYGLICMILQMRRGMIMFVNHVNNSNRVEEKNVIQQVK